MSTSVGLTVVLAEDDDGHALLIQRNLSRAGLAAPIVRVRHGLELLDLLEADEQLRQRSLLVLLDIRMPYLDGVQTLSRLKKNETTACIPVYMLSTTDDRREIERCFQLGCNAYIAKPIAPDALVDAIQRLASFLQITTIPGAFCKEAS